MFYFHTYSRNIAPAQHTSKEGFDLVVGFTGTRLGFTVNSFSLRLRKILVVYYHCFKTLKK